MQEFNHWLEAEGLQAIATRVSTGGECSLIIEDGYVVGADQKPAEEPVQSILHGKQVIFNEYYHRKDSQFKESFDLWT